MIFRFVNRAALGFEDLDDINPTMLIKLSPSEFGPDKQIRLKAVGFQNVNSLHVFVDGAGS